MGVSSTDPQDRGQRNYRPAAWIPGHEPVFLTDLEFAWGQAVDINEAGATLLVAYTKGIPGKSKALLWHPIADTLSFVGSDEPDGIYPNSLAAEGLVLGARTRPARRSRCVSRRGRPGTAADVDDGWYATTMNDGGDIAGSHTVEGFDRPWLRRSTGDVVCLPYFEHHHCRPSSMTANGILVGSAQSDHGTHALLWLPSQ